MTDDEASGKSPEDLQRYLSDVSAQLQKREERLMSIQSEIAALEHKLRSMRVERSMLSGDARKIAAGEACRTALRKKLEREYRVREEALAEVSRARERKLLVEQEMKANVAKKTG